MNYFRLSKISLQALFLLLACSFIVLAQTKPDVSVLQIQPKNALPYNLETVIAEISKIQPPKKILKSAESIQHLPSDTASIDEIMEYWGNVYQRQSSKALPTEIVTQRLFDACLNRPETCNSLLDLFPKSQVTFNALYTVFQETPADEKDDLDFIKTYLRSNSQYFRTELVNLAEEGREEGLRELSKLDWEAAQPIVEKLANSSDIPQKIEALFLRRTHALEVKNFAQADSDLSKLKEFVSNRQYDPNDRSLAIKALMGDKWEGRDDWFLSLLSDPALSGLEVPDLEQKVKSSLGNTEVVSEVPKNTTKQYRENLLAREYPLGNEEIYSKIIKLVGNSDPQFHNGAVSFLATSAAAFSQSPEGKIVESSNYIEVTRALLPWLTNKNWAQASGRRSFIYSLSIRPKQEYASSLMTMLSDESEDVRVQIAAILVLHNLDKSRFIPYFKGLLVASSNSDLRSSLAKHVHAANGFSEEEQLNGLEVFLRNEIDLQVKENGGQGTRQLIKSSTNLIIGAAVQGTSVPLADSVISGVMERVKTLRTSEPELARRMLKRVDQENNRISQLSFVERIRTGDTDVESLTNALAHREDFQKNVSETLLRIVLEGGFSAGIASVMLGGSGYSLEILTSKDEKAQLALLVCARYVRDKLPLKPIQPLLNNPVLATVGEKYLEVENSRLAREMIWARHPQQAWIVGEGGVILASDKPKEHDSILVEHLNQEKKIQNEILTSKDLVSILTFILPPKNWTIPNQISAVAIRVKATAAEISLQYRTGFQKNRMLTSSEFSELKHLMSLPEIEDLYPETSYSYLFQYERMDFPVFLRIGKDSSRRIIFESLRRAPKKDATLYEQLSGIFSP